ncbi:unnamed protein product [Boreogadus saida]
MHLCVCEMNIKHVSLKIAHKMNRGCITERFCLSTSKDLPQVSALGQSVHQRVNGPAKYLSFQSFTPIPFPFPFLPTLATQWPWWATHVLKSKPSEANAKPDGDE